MIGRGFDNPAFVVEGVAIEGGIAEEGSTGVSEVDFDFEGFVDLAVTFEDDAAGVADLSFAGEADLVEEVVEVEA